MANSTKIHKHITKYKHNTYIDYITNALLTNYKIRKKQFSYRKHNLLDWTSMVSASNMYNAKLN